MRQQRERREHRWAVSKLPTSPVSYHGIQSATMGSSQLPRDPVRYRGGQSDFLEYEVTNTLEPTLLFLCSDWDSLKVSLWLRNIIREDISHSKLDSSILSTGLIIFVIATLVARRNWGTPLWQPNTNLASTEILASLHSDTEHRPCHCQTHFGLKLVFTGIYSICRLGIKFVMNQEKAINFTSNDEYVENSRQNVGNIHYIILTPCSPPRPTSPCNQCNCEDE